MLVTYQSNEIDGIWDKVKPLLNKVLQKIDLYYTIQDIKEMLLKKEAQIWTSYEGTQLDSVCITRIVIHPKNNYLEILAMAGSSLSLPHLRTIEDWGRDVGCKKIKLEGRRGWKRLLIDYKEGLIQLEKEL